MEARHFFLWQGWRAIDLLNWPLTIPTFGVLLEAIAEILQQMRPTNWRLVKFGRSATSVFHTVRWIRLNYLPIIFYLVDLNRERCRLLEILKSDGNSSSLLRQIGWEPSGWSIWFSRNGLGSSGVHEKNEPSGYVQQPPIVCDDDVFHRCLQGAKLQRLFSFFARCCDGRPTFRLTFLGLRF